MKIALLQTGKTTDKNISAVADLYTSRIKKYSAFEIITLPELKNTKNMPVPDQKIREGKRIIQSVNNEEYVILLDEKGKELKTVEFSELLERGLLSCSTVSLFMARRLHKKMFFCRCLSVF